MLRLTRVSRMGALGSITLVLGSAYTQCYAGTARIHFGLVQRWGEDSGSGMLFYPGHRRYHVIISGIEFEPGRRKIDLVGTARNLAVPADVNGTYHIENGGSAIVAGSKSVHMQNEKGVTLELHLKRNSGQSSVKLTGMTITGRF